MPPGVLIGILLAARGMSGTRRAERYEQQIGLMWVLMLVALVIVASLIAAGGWFLVPAAGGLALLGAPWLFTRAIVVPLGLVRTAYWIERIPSAVWSRDPHGGPLLAGAWALSRCAAHDEQLAAWLNARLSKTGTATRPGDRAALRGAGFVAAALLAASRGDRHGARTLMRGALELDAHACPGIAMRAASTWLAAEAAERGDWASIATLRGGGLLTLGPTAALLRAVALGFIGDAARPGPALAWTLWALAPNRGRTRDLVRRSLACAPDPASPQAHTPPPVRVAEGDRWGRALGLHACVVARGSTTTGAAVGAVAEAWDAALGALGGSAVDAMRRAIDDDLVALVVDSGIPLADLRGSGGMIDRVRGAARERLLREVELAGEALRRRVDDQRELPAADEWREIDRFRTLHVRGSELAGPEFRRLAFITLNTELSHAAVWLFNERKERALGNAIFRFCLEEARAVGDDAAVALHTKNVACGP